MGLRGNGAWGQSRVAVPLEHRPKIDGVAGAMEYYLDRRLQVAHGREQLSDVKGRRTSRGGGRAVRVRVGAFGMGAQGNGRRLMQLAPPRGLGGGLWAVGAGGRADVEVVLLCLPHDVCHLPVRLGVGSELRGGQGRRSEEVRGGRGGRCEGEPRQER